MNINHKNYIKLNEGNYTIGINRGLIENIDAPLLGRRIRREYLLNSCPEHRVFIKDVFINKFLVTLSQFEEFIYETGFVTEAESKGWGWTSEDNRWIKKHGLSWRSPFGNRADQIYLENRDIVPILQLSWDDADAYCKWLSQKTINMFRLPYEKEWEIFAKTVGVSSIKDIAIETEALVKKPEYYINTLINRIKCRRNLNGTSLLWEWTMDWFDAYPSGISNREFGTTYKVLRGGSLQSCSIQKGREYRFRRCPTARSPFYGFRIAMERT